MVAVTALSRSLDVAAALLELANSEEGRELIRRLLGTRRPTVEEIAERVRALPVPPPPKTKGE